MSTVKADYGDPLDFPDIPPDADLDDEYMEDVMPPWLKQGAGEQEMGEPEQDPARQAAE